LFTPPLPLLISKLFINLLNAFSIIIYEKLIRTMSNRSRKLWIHSIYASRNIKKRFESLSEKFPLKSL
jgi:hypothetical protein